MSKLNEDLLTKARMEMAPNEYKIVSLRQSAKSATMMNVMSVVLDKPISSMLTEEISDALAEYLLEDEENIGLLEKYMKKFVVAGYYEELSDEDNLAISEGATRFFSAQDAFKAGCLSVLQKSGLIDYVKSNQASGLVNNNQEEG